MKDFYVEPGKKLAVSLVRTLLQLVLYLQNSLVIFQYNTYIFIIIPIYLSLQYYSSIVCISIYIFLIK